MIDGDRIEVKSMAVMYNDHISRLHKRKKGGWLMEQASREKESEPKDGGLGRAEKHVAGDVLVTEVFTITVSYSKWGTLPKVPD